MKRPGFNAIGKRAGLVLGLAALLLVALTVSVWAAWGAGLRLGFGAALQASLTATPTRTPRPETPAPQQVPVELVIVAPTAAATPTALPTPPAAPARDPMPPLLARVAKEYGIDATRRFVVVDVDAQTMYAWEPGNSVREMPVSTGDTTKGYRTPAWYGLVGDYWGTFQTRGVYADEGWYLYQDAGDILVHSAPYKLVNGEKVYQEMDALGNFPASRGCIRLAPEDARWFTEWSPKGVPFVVLPRSEG
jgi:lipoprotein-anchoring transpeptidase ErfK/SrfK